MKTIIKKEKLLSIVKENLEKHVKSYDEAKIAYETKGVEMLSALIKKLQRGETIKPYLNLPVPENHQEEYDRVIEMLELDTRDEIELEENEFRQLVQDNWSWKQGWLDTTASYITEDRL